VKQQSGPRLRLPVTGQTGPLGEEPSSVELVVADMDRYVEVSLKGDAMAQVSVLIGVDDKKASLPDVAAELTKRGLRITRSMPNIGIISGDADSQQLEGFSQVHGVNSVRTEGRFQLPPVREDIPQ